MSPKLLRQIIAVLLGAVVGWGLLASWQRQRQQAENKNAVTLPALTAATTDTIHYSGNGDQVLLVRNGQRWTVNGQAAGQPVVDAFFHAMVDTSARSELIAESPASYERLGVDSARARRLVVSGGGKTLLDLRFGGRGPDFEGFYVRQGDDPKVYLLRGTFANMTVQGVDDWRDKAIIAIGRDSIGHLEVRRGKTQYQVKRGANSWSVGNGTADSVALARVLGSFTTLRSTGYPRPEQVDSATFSPAEREVRIFNLAGAPIAELQLDSMSWGWMVRTTGGALYKLDQRMIDQITPLPDSLLKR